MEDHSASRDHAPATGSALVDLSKIKPGDEVSLRAFVSSIDGNFVRVTWTKFGPALPGLFTHSAIVSHAPKPLEVGDAARQEALRLAVAVYGGPGDPEMVLKAAREYCAFLTGSEPTAP